MIFAVANDLGLAILTASITSTSIALVCRYGDEVLPIVLMRYNVDYGCHIKSLDLQCSLFTYVGLICCLECTC